MVLEDVLCIVLYLIERFFFDYLYRFIGNKVQQYYWVLVVVFLSCIWYVCRQVQQMVWKLLFFFGGFKLVYGFLEELKIVFSFYKVLFLEVLVIDVGEVIEVGKVYVFLWVLQEVLCVIFSVLGFKGDVIDIE